ncbi:hypothetical protein C8R47DRAFT_96796 [Mycena vitilis]|nr:hypothetical protein C8R47DRAFT_96796 [Mycena vitilis]
MLSRLTFFLYVDGLSVTRGVASEASLWWGKAGIDTDKNSRGNSQESSVRARGRQAVIPGLSIDFEKRGAQARYRAERVAEGLRAFSFALLPTSQTHSRNANPRVRLPTARRLRARGHTLSRSLSARIRCSCSVRHRSRAHSPGVHTYGLPSTTPSNLPVVSRLSHRASSTSPRHSFRLRTPAHAPRAPYEHHHAGAGAPAAPTNGSVHTGVQKRPLGPLDLSSFAVTHHALGADAEKVEVEDNGQGILDAASAILHAAHLDLHQHV